MSTIQTDFDRIALVSPEGSLQNTLYHGFLLRHLPECRQSALEVGCGKGELSRRLAESFERVLAIDLSPEMIRLAREHSPNLTNLEFELADILTYELPAENYDCIATIATLHHLPLREVLLKLKAALKSGGVLLVLDLFEPAKWHGHPARNLSIREGLIDSFLNLIALPVSVSLRLVHHRRLLPRREVRAAWNDHARHDIYPAMREVRVLCAEIFPGAKIQKHLLWRYSIVWRKPL
jgi:ubiquinone/menaquinone biosynthesis C-methylase UbiE